MYRGAWAEWELENIEMCVPLSPAELRAKRNSILKHQSQMESAPFLGNDERLFWQSCLLYTSEKIRAMGIGAPCGNYYKGTIENAANLVWAKGIVPLADKMCIRDSRCRESLPLGQPSRYPHLRSEPD